MPHRLPGLLEILIGTGLVLGLTVAGIRLAKLRDRGPRWLAPLLLAGLAFLGWTGSPTRAVAEEVVRTRSGENLPVEWQKLDAIWQEAEEVASGKRGPYPFDEAGKDRLLKDVASAAGLIEALVKSGHFRPAEGDLLKLDLKDLENGVGEKRPKELELATCYQPMMFTPVKDSFSRLSDRLPLLEKLASAALSPEIAGRILDKMVQDLETLGQQKPDNSWDSVEPAKIEALRARLKPLLDKVRPGKP